MIYVVSEGLNKNHTAIYFQTKNCVIEGSPLRLKIIKYDSSWWQQNSSWRLLFSKSPELEVKFIQWNKTNILKEYSKRRLLINSSLKPSLCHRRKVKKWEIIHLCQNVVMHQLDMRQFIMCFIILLCTAGL